MNKNDAIKKMNEYMPINEKKVINKSVDAQGHSFKYVRDHLIGVGKIVEENFDDTFYVMYVPAGSLNMNSAIVLVKWNKTKIVLYSYAKEGLINQHTAQKALDKVVEAL